MLTLLITVLDFISVQELEISGKIGCDVKNGVNHDENIKFKDENRKYAPNKFRQC